MQLIRPMILFPIWKELNPMKAGNRRMQASAYLGMILAQVGVVEYFIRRSSRPRYIMGKLEVGMNIPVYDEQDPPKPPADIQFRDAAVEVLPDGRRVRLKFEITPFQTAPNLEIAVFNPDGEEAASTTIIGAMGPHMSIVLHLRGALTPGMYCIEMLMGYEDEPPVDQRQVKFHHA